MFAHNIVAAQSSPQTTYPADWLTSLSGLLKTVKTKFKRIDALLVSVADDFAGGVMLRWVLYWLPRSHRPDGFYKSAAEWEAETGLSKHQVERLKKAVLPHCGVDVTVRKANGAPTCHYRLDALRFIHRLSTVLKVPMPYLLVKLQQSGNPFTEKREMDFPESGKTLTTDSTNESSKQVVNDSVVSLKAVELLKKAGVRGQDTLTYGILPQEIVEACIASADEPGVRNRVAYLKAALKNQLEQHATQPSQSKPPFQNFTPETPDATEAPPPNPLPVAAAEPDAPATVQGTWADSLRRLREGLNNRVTSVAIPEAVPAHLAVMVNEQFSAQQAWSAAYHQLELQLDRSTFDTYLRAATLVGFEADRFVVRVHSTHVRDMLQHRHQLYKTATRILRDVTGRDMSISYETDETSTTSGNSLKRFLNITPEGNDARP